MRFRRIANTVLLLLVVSAGACEPSTPQAKDTAAPGMGAARRAAAASARDVVMLLAEWDTAGLTLGDTSPFRAARDSLICWMPEEQCQTDEPGWDVTLIVSGFELKEMSERGDSASAVVSFSVIGELVGWQLRDSTSIQVWRPKLSRIGGRWFVVDPESQRPPAISPATALRLWAKTSSDSAAISQLGDRRPPA